MCPHCRAFITKRDRVCPYCNEHVGPRAADRPEFAGGHNIGGFIPHAQFVTVMLLLINFALYIATTIYSMRHGNSGAVMDLDAETLYWFGAKFLGGMGLPGIRTGQWWRLVTAGFLHGGILHILMNAWVLFDLGARVEDIYGGARLFLYYFVSTVFGFYASSWWSPAMSVGASAGIFGLIGAMIAYGVRYHSSFDRSMYIRWAVYGFLFGLLPGFRVDNAAHLGGLASGFVIAYVSGTPRITNPLGERLWQAAAVLSILLTALSFYEMFLWFSAGAHRMAP